MIAESQPQSPVQAGVVVDVGNSAVKLGLWRDDEISQVVRMANDAPTDVADAVARLVGELADETRTKVIISSTNPPLLQNTISLLGRNGVELLVVGDDIPVPARMDVEAPEQVGVDRLCAAAAAFDRTQHACIVIDLGSAITVDLIGDDGLFLGGAILPGLAMQMSALHERTAALPAAKLSLPASPVGRNTRDAMCSGVAFGTVGALRGLVERFASQLGTWPQVIATGGDLDFLKSECDFCDSWVPDLCLIGVGLAYSRWTRRE